MKLAMEAVRVAYPYSVLADGKTLGDQIAGRIEAAYRKKPNAGMAQRSKRKGASWLSWLPSRNTR